MRKVRRQFALFKAKLYALVAQDDAFGMSVNCNPGQMRGADGRCGHGIGLDVPRDEMPQVPRDEMGDFIAWSYARGVPVGFEILPAERLQPVQKEFRQERVDTVDSSPLLISSDDRILDGTHRWLKKRQSGDETVAAFRVPLPVDLALDHMRSYPGAKFVANQRFATSPQKLDEFQRWMQQQLDATITSTSMEEAWDRYIEDGYLRGGRRAYIDSTNGGLKPDLPPEYYSGRTDDFLRTALGAPESVEKAKLLASRSFSDLRGVTDQMGARMGRVLTDALVRGAGPKEAARELADEVDISLSRAETVARTEFIRAHAEGQLEAFDQLGVEELGVDVEFLDTGDDLVCPECAALNGTIFSIEDAHGVIPVHPNCRCAFIPHFKTQNERLAAWDRILNDSFFARCDRDDKGRCLPGQGGGPHGQDMRQDPHALVDRIRAAGVRVPKLTERIPGLNPKGVVNGVLKVPKGMRQDNRDKIEQALGVRVVPASYRHLEEADVGRAERLQGIQLDIDKLRADMAADKIPEDGNVLVVPKAAAPLGTTEFAQTPVDKTKKLGGGINGSYIAVLADGTKAVWKPADEEKTKGRFGEPLRDSVPGGDAHIREAAAYAVAQHVGLGDLVPETVVRDVNGRVGSMQRFVDGAKTAMDRLVKGDINVYDGKEGLQNLAAFDYLIGNTDRHAGNWMIKKGDQSKNDKLIAIDHGLAFPLNERELRSWPIDHAQKFDTKIPEFVKNIDPVKLRGVLEKAGIRGTAQNRTIQRLEKLKAAHTFNDLTSRMGFGW